MYETKEKIRVCAQCYAVDCREVFVRDEGLTVCNECSAIEGGYSYIDEDETLY